MANSNTRLNEAAKAKKDEFYTRYEDVSAELSRYKDQFRGKRVICPCDWDESLDEVCVYVSEEYAHAEGTFDLRMGAVKEIDLEKTDVGVFMRDINNVKCNFVKFLLAHAEAYGIASISVSGFNPATGEGVRFQDLDYSKYDLCTTNPPFSQFREFIKTMADNDMEFLVIGHQNAITYKEVFPLMMGDKVWLGYGFKRNCAHFINPFYKDEATDADHREGMIRVSGVTWFTNLDVEIRHDQLTMVETYDPKNYPDYDNYKAIEVSAVKKIPYDYTGVMGVPITFMYKYNPDQFQILGASESEGDGFSNGLWMKESAIKQPTIAGEKKYKRLFIKNREPVPYEN